MAVPRIAIPSFPGSNGEVDNLKTLRRCGFDCFIFRWNDSTEKLHDVDGYFFGAGFSYEDRGRSGMVAARDPLFKFLHEESGRGKVLVGNCNGAQMLVESGLIPLGNGLRMSLARNAIRTDNHWVSPGFLNHWLFITRTCDSNRCATADWDGVMHVPIAHGEGRFVTKDPDIIALLKENDQIAFQYCDAEGEISEYPDVTPNGSTMAIAGICNPAGNVVALMPHPERTPLGDEYFTSMYRWIHNKKKNTVAASSLPDLQAGGSPRQKEGFESPIKMREPKPVEIFIDTIITNNEERTVEQAAHRVEPKLKLKQYRYIGLDSDVIKDALSSFSIFNAHKEIAYVRKNGKFYHWNANAKKLDETQHTVFAGISLLRRDEPDTGAGNFGKGSETGVCYDCRHIEEQALQSTALLEVFANPHASTLELLH